MKDATFLSAALHECVHLVSDPARQGAKESSARSKLGEGLLEGLVETVTQNILSDQNITLAPAGMRGHAKRVAIINDLMPEECIPIFARVLFQGADAQLSLVMDLVYSKSGWNNIKNLATADQTDLARKVMATRTMSRNTQTLLDTVLKMIP